MRGSQGGSRQRSCSGGSDPDSGSRILSWVPRRSLSIPSPCYLPFNLCALLNHQLGSVLFDEHRLDVNFAAPHVLWIEMNDEHSLKLDTGAAENNRLER